MVSFLQFRGFFWLIALALILGQGALAQAPLEAAHDAMAEYQAARDAANQLYAAGITSQEQADAVRKKEAEAKVHLQTALQHFRDAGLPDQGALPAIKAYAQALRSDEDYDLAAEALARAIELNPDDGLLRVERGECLALEGPATRAEAYEVLRGATNYELTTMYSARAWFQLGRLYFEDALYDFARDAFDKVLEFQPDAVRTRIALAALDAREGKMVEASQALDSLGRAAQPYDIETRVMLRQALAAFDESRRIFKDTPANHAAYARLLYRAGRAVEATGVGEQAARRHPEDTEFLNFLGAVYMQLGDADGARSAYQRSLAANPDQPLVKQSLATIPEETEEEPAPATNNTPQSQ